MEAPTEGVKGMYRDLEANGRADGDGGGLSKRTVRYVHTILQKALDDAVKQGLIRFNPARMTEPPKAKDAAPPEMHTWTEDQLKAFRSWCSAPVTDGGLLGRAELAVAWTLLAMTGIRRGEALALKWSDVDFDAPTITVRRSVGVLHVHGEPERLLVGPTKGRRARMIELDPGTLAALRAHRRDLSGIDLSLARNEALVLGRATGEHQHPERFSRRFRETVAAARRELGDEALPVIRLHDLRHTHATLLLKNKVPIQVVSERLGYASASITLNYYAHVQPTMQADAANLLGALIFGASS